MKTFGMVILAKCADGGDLIEVQDYYSWDTYHPFD